MYKLHCRTEWKRCASPRRWALASGLLILSSIGMMFTALSAFKIVGAAVSVCWIVLQIRRLAVYRLFSDILSGRDLIAEWTAPKNGPAVFSRRGVYCCGTFIRWRRNPDKGLKRAEFNRHTGIFKFVIAADDVFRPWTRRHYSFKINVPDDAIDAACAAEQYFSAFAAHHRRQSLVDSPNASETRFHSL